MKVFIDFLAKLKVLKGLNQIKGFPRGPAL